MDQDLVNQVIAVLRKFDKTGKSIEAGTDIAAELDLDSLAVMDVIMELEDSLDISIPLNLIPDIKTVGDLADTIGQLKEES
ncbi:MAG: acyl carrier protein [Geminicoccaceae bacterium]